MVWKVLTFSNVVVFLGLAYMSYTASTLYSVARPTIPSLLDEQTGIKKVTITPLWQGGRIGIDVALTTGYGDSRTPLTVLNYSGNRLTYELDQFHSIQLQLRLADEVLQVWCIPDGHELGDLCGEAGLQLVNTTSGNTAQHTADAAQKNDNAPGYNDVRSTFPAGSRLLGEWSDKNSLGVRSAIRNGHDISALITMKLLNPPENTPNHETSISQRVPLVVLRPYRPLPVLRYLLADPSGEISALRREEERSSALLPSHIGPASKAAKVGLRLKASSQRKLRPLDTEAVPCRLDGDAGNGTDSMCYLATPNKLWPHFISQVDVKLVMETREMPKAELPPSMAPYLALDRSGSKYLPFITVNPVQPVQEAFVPINATTTTVPLRVRIAHVSGGSMHLLKVMDAGLSAQQELGASEKDTDELVRMLSDTPLWLLGLTMLVSFIHLLCDVLAIQSDISFWANTTSLKGISLRTLLMELGSQTIITLYLYNEASSLLVLLPQVASNILLVAKIAKACGVVWTRKWGLLPVPMRDVQLAATATEGNTQGHDKEALKYMSAVICPLILGFVAYSLVYQQHKGWADWLLSASVGTVYAFGFALMTPQLWINYKLRSVAHMPWNVLMYRFFNTIIDDLFASIIRMPLMHRISVFRDDVIFVIYMYQRWQYPVDRSRPAEGYDGGEATVAHSDAVKQD